MNELSNTKLLILVSLTILTSVLGIFLVLNGPHQATITGAATNESFGAANITIQSVTQVRLVNRTVDFGSGFVNSSGNFCTLESNSSTKSAACSGFYSPANASNFVIENIGNVNVSLDINGTYSNATSFLCILSNPNTDCSLSTPEYNFSVADNEAGSCKFSSTSISGNNLSWARQLNVTVQRICGSLDFNASANAVNVSLRLNIPRDSRQGTLNDTVTFLATTG